MMANMQIMMAGMGVFWLFVLVAFVIVIAAAVKCLFFGNQENDR